MITENLVQFENQTKSNLVWFSVLVFGLVSLVMHFINKWKNKNKGIKSNQSIL